MKNKVRELQSRLSNSKDGKALAGNFGYMMLLQISGYLFPLITIPYLARVVGVEGFGKIAFAAAVVLWFQTITDWGFNYTATRDVAQNRDDSEKVSEIFSNVLWARVFLMGGSFVSLMLAIELIPYFKANESILLMTFLLVPGHILLPEWFFQAIERMKFITIFSLLVKLVFTTLIFIFVNEREDYLLQPLFISVGYLTAGSISLYIIIFRWKIKLKKPNVSQVMHTIKCSADVFINNIAPNLYNSFSVVLLGFVGGSASNGIFDAGTKFSNIIRQFLTTISRVFFPFLSRKIGGHNLYLRINLIVSCVSVVFLLLFAPAIIKLFFVEEFYDAILILQISSVSLIFLALSDAYGLNYLIINGHTKRLRNITLCISVFGFFLAFPMIMKFDHVGAALTITLVRILLGSTITIAAIRLKSQLAEGV